MTRAIWSPRKLIEVALASVRMTNRNPLQSESSRESFSAQAESPASLVAFGMRVWIVVLQAWFAVLYAECVVQVLGFSAWRALLNTFLAATLVVVPGVLVVLVLSILFG